MISGVTLVSSTSAPRHDRCSKPVSRGLVIIARVSAAVPTSRPLCRAKPKLPSESVRRTFVHTVRWHDRREDFAAVRWYLHCEETAFSAAYQVEGYAHAMRERFGVMPGSLLGHKAASSLHRAACFLLNELKRGLAPGPM